MSAATSWERGGTAAPHSPGSGGRVGRDPELLPQLGTTPGICSSAWRDMMCAEAALPGPGVAVAGLDRNPSEGRHFSSQERDEVQDEA